MKLRTMECAAYLLSVFTRTLGHVRLLSGYARLSRGDRRLLVRSAVLQMASAAALRLCRFGRVGSAIERLDRVMFPLAPRSAPDRVAWAVATVQYHAGRADTCLIQALAAQAILRRQGDPVELRIGVRHQMATGPAAHAWVVSADRIIIGGAAAAEYIPLTTLKGEAR